MNLKSGLQDLDGFFMGVVWMVCAACIIIVGGGYVYFVKKGFLYSGMST
jgi:hypothetical protein